MKFDLQALHFGPCERTLKWCPHFANRLAMALSRLYITFFLVASLLLSDLVVLAHAASHLPPTLDGTTQGLALETAVSSRNASSRKASSSCQCVFHQRTRDRDGVDANDHRSEGGSRTSEGSGHDADSCSLCRSIYTARTHAIPVLSWIVAREAVIEHIASCYVFPTLDGQFVSVVTERGPPA